MYSVTKRIDFCYGHRLLDYDGVCKHPHGHNAKVEIEVRTGSLDNRNMVCDFSDIKRIVKGWIDRALDHNPFPDATPAFRASIAQTLSLGLAHPLRVDAPYATSSKADVIRKGIALGVPFEHTMSCMKPVVQVQVQPVHCGTCSKCRERHDAFLETGLQDPTTYASVEFTRG